MTDHDATIDRALLRLRYAVMFGRNNHASTVLRDLVAEVAEKSAEEAGKRACRAHRDRLARIVALCEEIAEQWPDDRAANPVDPYEYGAQERADLARDVLAILDRHKESSDD